MCVGLVQYYINIYAREIIYVNRRDLWTWKWQAEVNAVVYMTKKKWHTEEEEETWSGKLHVSILNEVLLCYNFATADITYLIDLFSWCMQAVETAVRVMSALRPWQYCKSIVAVPIGI